jgi:hypothetical protein
MIQAEARRRSILAFARHGWAVVPAIHEHWRGSCSWVAGTSPAMTILFDSSAAFAVSRAKTYSLKANVPQLLLESANAVNSKS